MEQSEVCPQFPTLEGRDDYPDQHCPIWQMERLSPHLPSAIPSIDQFPNLFPVWDWYIPPQVLAKPFSEVRKPPTGAQLQPSIEGAHITGEMPDLIR